jgi:midasin (ATPase involved in ribosome maturation)
MPGIAKSRVALYMAKKVNNYNGREDMPLFETSIKPDTPVGDVIGRWVLRNGESVFEEGPVLKALSADSVVSVEEFNNADHDVQSMLQRIMLLKVGEPFVVQQGDAKKEYVRGKNFCIIASANPDTKATNRFKLDNAMRERFTGGIFESLYPDSKVKLGEDLEEIPDFVDSLLVDKATLKRKLPNKHWSDEDVDKLGRVAYWTQVLATNPGSTLKIDERNPSSKYIEGMLD